MTQENQKASESMSTYVPAEVAQSIKADAAADNRTESYVIAQILKRHYARRTPASGKIRRAA